MLVLWLSWLVSKAVVHCSDCVSLKGCPCQSQGSCLFICTTKQMLSTRTDLTCCYSHLEVRLANWLLITNQNVEKLSGSLLSIAVQCHWCKFLVVLEAMEKGDTLESCVAMSHGWSFHWTLAIGDEHSLGENCEVKRMTDNRSCQSKTCGCLQMHEFTVNYCTRRPNV